MFDGITALNPAGHVLHIGTMPAGPGVRMVEVTANVGGHVARWRLDYSELIMAGVELEEELRNAAEQARVLGAELTSGADGAA